MDTGIAVQPATAGLAPPELARQAVVAVQSAAATDLPQAKAVNPLPQAAPTHNQTPLINPGTADIAHNFVVDPQTQNVVYRVMDMLTRQVLFQVPDAALLRRIAYERAQAANALHTPITSQTDVRG
jgi:hypothetical protein